MDASTFDRHLQSAGITVSGMMQAWSKMSGGDFAGSFQEQASADGTSTTKMPDFMKHSASTEAAHREAAAASQMRHRDGHRRDRRDMSENSNAEHGRDTADETDPFVMLMSGAAAASNTQERALHGAGALLGLGNEWTARASEYIKGVHRLSNTQRDRGQTMFDESDDEEYIDVTSARRATLASKTTALDLSTASAANMLAFLATSDGSAIATTRDVAHGVSRAATKIQNFTYALKRSLGNADARWKPVETRDGVRPVSRTRAREHMHELFSPPNDADVQQQAREHSERLAKARRRMQASNESTMHKIAPRRIYIDDLPAWHTRSNGWLAGAVDWRAYWRSALLIAEADKHKMRWWASDASSGKDMPAVAQSGFRVLDTQTPPSVLGRSLRLVAAAMRGEHADWEHAGGAAAIDRAVSRRLQQTTSEDIAREGRGSGVVDYVAHVLENRGRLSRVRQLAETSSGYVMQVPYAAGALYAGVAQYAVGGTVASLFANTQLALQAVGVESDTPNDSLSGLVEAIGYYIVYNVFLCYLYTPPKTGSAALESTDSGQGEGDVGDGTSVTTMHGPKMCFPAIPFRPINMPTFSQQFNTSGVEWHNLEYTDACNVRTVQAAMQTLERAGITLKSSYYTPVAVFLRPAEAVDAIREYMQSARSSNTPAEAASHLVCGLTLSGGILYILLLFPLFVIILMLTPLLFAMCWCCSSAFTFGAAFGMTRASAATGDDKQKASERTQLLPAVTDNSAVAGARCRPRGTATAPALARPVPSRLPLTRLRRVARVPSMLSDVDADAQDYFSTDSGGDDSVLRT